MRELNAHIAHDGERRTCSCGLVWEYVCEPGMGRYWTPQVRRVGRRDKTEKFKREQHRRAAQD